MGLALASTGFARDLWAAPHESAGRAGLFAAVFAGVLIFTMSMIVLCRLCGVLQREPVESPGHHIVNLFALLLCGWLGYSFVTEQAQPFGLAALLCAGALAMAMGAHLTLSREYSGESDHASHHDGCALRMHRCAARGDGLSIGKPGLLANLEWHGGEEQIWALRDSAPSMTRMSACADHRIGRDDRRCNGRLRDCAREHTHRRPVHPGSIRSS